VRTHLENIYGRLQVSSRTAAVIRAFPDQIG
jgi:DNA-binding NarL/FixJ family response regulator